MQEDLLQKTYKYFSSQHYDVIAPINILKEEKYILLKWEFIALLRVPSSQRMCYS